MSVWSEAGAVRLLPVLLLPHLHPRQPPPEVLQEEVRLQATECKGGWRWVWRRLLPAPWPKTGQQGHLCHVQVRLLQDYGFCFCDSVLWLFPCTLSQEKGNGYLSTWVTAPGKENFSICKKFQIEFELDYTTEKYFPVSSDHVTKYHWRELRVTEASDDDVIMLSTAVRRTIGVFCFSELEQQRRGGPATDAGKSFNDFIHFWFCQSRGHTGYSPLVTTRVSLTDGGRILAAAVWLEAAHSSSHGLHRQLRNGMNGAVLWENKLGNNGARIIYYTAQDRPINFRLAWSYCQVDSFRDASFVDKLLSFLLHISGPISRYTFHYLLTSNFPPIHFSISLSGTCDPTLLEWEHVLFV